MIIQFEYTKKFPEVKGVFVGGCVERGEGSRFHAKAHTHTDKNDPHYNWICFLSERRLNCEELILHEVAHAITGQGHTDAWRKKLLEIGGTLDEVREINGKGVILRSYKKKTRVVNAK